MSKVKEQFEPKRWDYETEEEYQHALAAFEYAWACVELAASKN